MGNSSWAAISYSVAGSNYTQNFDTATAPDGSTGLPNNSQGQSANASMGITGTATYGWRNDFGTSTAGNWSIIGWHLLHPLNAPGTSGINQEGGFNGNQRMRFGTGSSGTGAFYSFGSASASTERALGIVNSTNLTNPSSMTHPTAYMGAVFTNDTGSTLTEFTLSYFGEQWRNSGVDGQQSLTFDYSLNAANIQDLAATRVAVPELTFTSPVFGGGSVQSGIGNTSGRVAIGPVTVTGLNWAPGTNLWIRWKDLEDGSSVDDHGLAIDDLVFSANVGSGNAPGDFDGNGVFDARDYAIWRITDENDTAGYEAWAANYDGGVPGGGSGASGFAVPEPAAIMLVLSFAPLILAGSRQTRN